MVVASEVKAGVIEGFFGQPWSWSARLDAVPFLRDSGYRFYVYAPKADAHLRRRWREPIPAEALRRLHDLHQSCRQYGLAFGLGLSPFEIYVDYDSAARRALRSKVLQINEIGPETFCVLFDDMQGALDPLASLQARVVADICEWSTAAHFIVCPTYYSTDPRLTEQFGEAPPSYLRDLGRLLDGSIDVFWTGERVISDRYSEEHLAVVAEQIRRQPFIWDNHIANDSRTRTSRLFLDPSAGGWNLPADRVAGLAINPMNQPYLSQLALTVYRRLLSGDSGEGAFAAACSALCPPPLAERLVEDAGRFQHLGLEGLDAAAREVSVTQYAAHRTNPYARDVLSWLQGDYAFDPQCLTD